MKSSNEGAISEVRGSESCSRVQVEISDTGWGIAADDLDTVWEELARGLHARGVEGSGLGLSIVRVIVEPHCGNPT